MTSGVVCLGLDKPYYAALCANLAISQKATNPNVPIAFLTTPNAFDSLLLEHKSLFDKVVFVPQEKYTFRGKLDYSLSKMCVSEFAPFDENLYIDSDSLFARNASVRLLLEHYRRFGSVYFLNFAEANPSDKAAQINNWGSVGDFDMFALKAPIACHLQGSVIYFQKKEITRKIFERTKEVYRRINDENISVKARWFGLVVDELCFGIAMSELNHRNRAENWNICVSLLAQSTNIDYVVESYSDRILSFPTGETQATQASVDFYNRLITEYATQLNTTPATLWKQKSEVAAL